MDQDKAGRWGYTVTPHCFLNLSTAAAAKSLQSFPTLCDPIDGSPPGSPVPGILQARTLEWVAISFSNASKWKVKVKLLSRARLLATPWTVAYQAPPSMGFSRQEYWSGLPLPSPHFWYTESYNIWQSTSFFNFLFYIWIQLINNVLISFRWTVKRLSHTYRCIYSPLNSAPIQAAT